MRTVLLLMIASFTLLLTTGCQEETPAPKPEAPPAAVETAKEAPKTDDMMAHAKDQAHQAFEQRHQDAKDVHQAAKDQIKQAEQESAEKMVHAKDQAHQAFDQLHQDAKHAHDTAKLVAKPTAETLAAGKAVYDKTCAACHATGIAGAPKVGDKAAWTPHLAEGLDHLVHVAIAGEGAMPPRGGNPQLTDDEIRAAISYMLAESR